MRKIITILVFLPLISIAQDTTPFIARGLFSGKGTVAAGLPTAYKGKNMYFSGNLEYYLEDNVSFRGGIYFFLGSKDMAHPFAMNSTLFTGYYYHFLTSNHLDPYLGLEPGISWSQLKKPDDPATETYPYNISKYPQSVNPVFSLTTGINYYASNWTHLFIEVKYIKGTHISDISAVPLDELRIAFGFGFNIWTIKRMKND